MKIYRPLSSTWISQGFGEDKACVELDTFGGIKYPQKVVGKWKGMCPPRFGSLYEALGLKAHNGVDFVAYLSEPIYHSADWDGIMKTEVDRAGGIGVDIISKEPLVHCEQCKKKHHVKLRNWHLQAAIGFDGREVKSGQVIGLAGNTGLSSGVHLHWGLKYCDKDGRGLHSDNGYYGAIDPTPYYENIPITEVKNIREQLNNTQITRKNIFAIKRFISKLS